MQTEKNLSEKARRYAKAVFDTIREESEKPLSKNHQCVGNLVIPKSTFEYFEGLVAAAYANGFQAGCVWQKGRPIR